MQHHATLVRSAAPQQYQVPASQAEVVPVAATAFGVADAARLRQLAQYRPAAGAAQTFVVSFDTITVEAQNALLKLFEDPPTATSFVVVAPPGLVLLPTLLSRLSVVATPAVTATAAQWGAFMQAPVAERLAQIAAWQKTKDAAWLAAMTDGLRHWLYTDGQATPLLLLVAERLATRGASNKLLLEALALELPAQ